MQLCRRPGRRQQSHADWQLGKPYGRFEPEVRVGLSEARFEVIDTLGRAAAEHGAQHVVVAGDIFDTEGPEDRTIVQAISRMSRHSCRWWLLPGNHDFVRNGGLWDRVRQRASENIVILSTPEPVEMNPGVWLLPAPLEHRHNFEDPTACFDAMETPGAMLRIGLAHGSIRDFGSQGETKNQIAPDRARRSNLDYLALGDWHGSVIRGRAVYPGTPEQTNYDEKDPGNVIIAEVGAACEAPVITKTRVGSLTWREYRRHIADDTDVNSLRSAIRSDGPLSQQLLRIIPAPDSNISREGLSALQSLREELLDGAFHLDWPEESMDIPVRDDAVLPEGLLSYIDADIQSLSEGKLPPGIQPGVLNIDNAVMTEARALLRRLHREGDA